MCDKRGKIICLTEEYEYEGFDPYAYEKRS
jgi:hypothetical protein